MTRTPDSFDFWNEAEADAGLERIHAEGGQRLAQLWALLHESTLHPIDASRGAEG